MGVYIGKRVLAIIPIILFSSLLMFVMIRVGPVDPAEAYLAAAHIQPDDEVLAAKRHEFGLDQPLLTQYVQSVVSCSGWISAIPTCPICPYGERLPRSCPQRFSLRPPVSCWRWWLASRLGC